MEQNKSSWKIYAFIICLIVFVPIWRNFLSTLFKQIPSNFSYSADLISVDNFYDEERGQFLGEQISNSNFSYEVIAERDGALLMENYFEVFTLTGEKIISIKRVLAVNSKTSLYDENLGDKSRVGSMFAPVGLKGGESFVYWHVNYDEPMVMRYVGEDVIEGLRTFRYEMLDDGMSIDQTSSLSHLDGVPEERGVRVYPTLDLWVEPVTGMLVKYEDSAEGYFYDLDTGVDIVPWNNFSNRYSEGAILNMVDDIESLKLKYLFVDYGVPALVGLLILALITLQIKYLLFKDMDEENIIKIKYRLAFGGFISLSLIMIYGIYFQYMSFLKEDVHNFRVGIISLNESSTIKENLDAFENQLEENGYVKNQNLEVYRYDAKGDKRLYVDTIREFILKDVDLIYTVTSPATKLAVREVSDVPIVFSIVSYPVREGLIDSFSDSGNNLVGVKHNIPIASQWYEFTKILDDNPQLEFDKIVFVSGLGSETVDLQYEDFVDYFKEEGIEVERVIGTSFDEMKRNLEELEGNYLLYAACDVFNQREGGEVLIKFSFDNDKVLISCLSSLVPDGALFSRSVDFKEIGEIAANKASLILEGASTRWLSTESPRKPLVNINSETAEVFGIDIDFEAYSTLLIFPQ